MGCGYFQDRRSSPPDPADRFARLSLAAFLAGVPVLIAGLVLVGNAFVGQTLALLLAGMAVIAVVGLFLMISIVCGFMVVRQKSDVVKWVVPAMVLVVFMAILGGLMFAFAPGSVKGW